MNPIKEQPEYIVAYDVEYMDDGEKKCETVRAGTPEQAVSELISYRGLRIKILSYPKYHLGCNVRYFLWKLYEEREHGSAEMQQPF